MIILCLQPILVSLIAPWMVGETVSRLRRIDLDLGLTGAVTVILARSGIAHEPLPGVLAAAGGLIGMTAATLYEKRFGVATHPVPANLIQHVVGAVFTLPLAWAAEGLQADRTPELLATLAYQVIGNSLISTTLLLAMVRAGEVARVSALFYLVPPPSALFAWPLPGEEMPLLAWAGMALAGIGVTLARRERSSSDFVVSSQTRARSDEVIDELHQKGRFGTPSFVASPA